ADGGRFHDAAVVHALGPAGAVARRPAFHRAKVIAANEGRRAFRRVKTSLPAARVRRCRGRERPGLDFGDVGAAPGNAQLLVQATAIGIALIAALKIDAARLPAGAIAVVRAVALVQELAHVIRPIAGNAALAFAFAVTRIDARFVTFAKGAHERRIAIGIDEAPFGETGERRLVAAAARKGADHDPRPGDEPRR